MTQESSDWVYPRRVVRNPRILGGEPTREGTRVSVRTIVEATRYVGSSERIVAGNSMLDPVSVSITLAFYQANREELDAHIAANAD